MDDDENIDEFGRYFTDYARGDGWVFRTVEDQGSTEILCQFEIWHNGARVASGAELDPYLERQGFDDDDEDVPKHFWHIWRAETPEIKENAEAVARWYFLERE
ncbi:hypothetical protein [Rhodobacter capsulatus]|uniref:Uncharacterized protein n=1 Tax=Rhodobacter phage RcapNL TaxID=1131316 RepID=H6WBN4_9CAUD|nr:hypothetical protein [Rhodobacter capsulatus]YP_007518413.1 hypothetical protein I920_gp31 [Rhodobacter phage RcapNL]AFK66536.1 hypothetical protein RHZG_00030 [Rhodobacter phage RcNL1]AFA44871.1 hypothetical protein RcapNL_00031 [Rhodobacter phage RcapNL]ETD02883.1 hypothetical protein U714_04125 [Rhodobacter capsulatus DE442]ETD79038.1 hypothetical protein U717_04130 [Rhodobacter capsulatus R121]ETE54953.1 hypothetical protein U715_04120 [Rhodobacter capsulatus Y262]